MFPDSQLKKHINIFDEVEESLYNSSNTARIIVTKSMIIVAKNNPGEEVLSSQIVIWDIESHTIIYKHNVVR
jgi:hypothetical protein